MVDDNNDREAERDIVAKIDYSTTSTCKKRLEKFEAYHERLTAEVADDTELLIEPERELGYIVNDQQQDQDEVCTHIIQYKTKFRQLHNKIVARRRSILEKQAAIQALETGREDLDGQHLAAENIGLNQELIDLKQQLKQKLIAKDQELIAKDQELIAKDQELIAGKQQLIAICHAPLSALLTKIMTRHQTVCSQLDIYKTKGNETAGTTIETDGLDEDRFDVSMVPSPTSAAKAQRVPCERRPPEGQQPEQLSEKFETLDSELCAVLTEEEKQELNVFQRFVAGLFKPTYKEANCSEEAVQYTVDIILNWKNDTKSHVDFKSLAYPNKTDMVTTLEQPIVCAIIWRILDILDQSHTITREHLVPPKTRQGKRRFIDLLVHQMRERLVKMHPAMSELPFDIKGTPPFECVKTWKHQLEKAEIQCSGHLGQRAVSAFHFCGIGEDIKVHAIVMTLFTVSVVQLELTNVGTSDVSVSCHRTKRIWLGNAATNPIPSLFSEGESFCVLAGAIKRTFQQIEARGKANATQLTVIDDIVGIQDDALANGSTLIRDRYLGSGAFADVYKIKDRDNAFLKIPKVPQGWRTLLREARALQALGSHANIPTFKSLSRFQVCVHRQVGRTIGLRLEGIIGTALLKSSLTARQLGEVMITSFSTLDYAHKKGVFHLDFRAGNVIVLITGNELRVMVTDWGCATRGENKFIFRGTVPYAHDGVIKRQNAARPCAAHDWASLAYTFYHCSTKKCPWIRDHFMVCNEADYDWLDKRTACVETWWNKLDKASLPGELKAAVVLGAKLKTRKVRNASSRPEILKAAVVEGAQSKTRKVEKREASSSSSSTSQKRVKKRCKLRGSP